MASGGREVQVSVVGVFEQQSPASEGQVPLHVVVLRDEIGRELHLPIGSCEGLAIHIALEQQLVPRPLTHDLALRVLEKLSARLDRVLIVNASDEPSAAELHLKAGDQGLSIPARPGDAVALALRAEAPVHVLDQIIGPAVSEDAP